MDAPPLAAEEVPKRKPGHESGLAVAARDLQHCELEASAAVGVAPADKVANHEALPRVQHERLARVLADERQPAEEFERSVDGRGVERDILPLKVDHEPTAGGVDPLARRTGAVEDRLSVIGQV